MANVWNEALWRQAGAALTMLDNAVVACPDTLWQERLWPGPGPDSDFPPQMSEFWFVVLHTLYWYDLYLAGIPEEDFKLPAFLKQADWLDSEDVVPEQPYAKEVLRGYLADLRERAHTALIGLTDEQAQRLVEYPWSDGQQVRYVELQLYSLRHLQDHVAQLNLFLGQHGLPDEATDWVTRADV